MELAPKKIASIAVLKGKHLLMGRRRDNNRYTLPGGHLDGEEHPHLGAIRELKEETGIDAPHLEHMGSENIISFTGKPMTIFAYKHQNPDDKEITTKLDPDKEVHKWEWIDTSKGLPEEILNNLHSPKNVVLKLLGLQKFKDNKVTARDLEIIKSEISLIEDFNKRFNEHKLLKSKINQLNDILKAAPVDISQSHILMYPVSIGGKHQPEKENLPPYHMTMKWLGDNPGHTVEDIKQKVKNYDLSPPKNFEIVPHHFDTPRGKIHVLLLNGVHSGIHEAESALKTGKELHPFVPHITVDEETWHKVKDQGLKAKDLGIKIHPLEYRVGHNTVHRFEVPSPRIEDYPGMSPDKGIMSSIEHKIKTLKNKLK